ncbi:hypothetical protein [Aeromonas simiae]|uniref:hypothetical protein n=1 Tax=Aeromonas simiae TaxID=218936 RepID=UPI00266D8FA7|nr:hypothetical protein [Aeromonas simiae]MDO2951481.1 hypothetical protein [Aeromonas simiae]
MKSSDRIKEAPLRPPSNGFAHNGFRNLAIALIVGWLTLFVLFPNLMILAVSLLTRDESQMIAPLFTLGNYLRLLDPLYWDVILHSLWLALLATLTVWRPAIRLPGWWPACRPECAPCCCFWWWCRFGPTPSSAPTPSRC